MCCTGCKFLVEVCETQPTTCETIAEHHGDPYAAVSAVTSVAFGFLCLLWVHDFAYRDTSGPLFGARVFQAASCVCYFVQSIGNTPF